jgi:hypothetical protein
MLGIYLQGFSPESAKTELAGLSGNYIDLMSRAAETAISLVTSNDELVGSIEGIECIMIESTYQNNIGNLRRSWLAMRRAVNIAQMMGLHRGLKSPSLKILDLETRSRIDPEHIWFRLVLSDRLLSLLLGLPQAWLENDFATDKALEKCTPLERVERMEALAVGLILQRNNADVHDLSATMEIDMLLQKSSDTMPPQWWLITDFSNCENDVMEAFRRTIHLMDQLKHFLLIVLLHLPFMLRFSADSKYDYNKITAVNASREVLSRYVAFRSFDPTGSHCRSVEFLAFISSTALCLAHIDASLRRHARTRATDATGASNSSVFDFLAHQRSSDRGMLERALACMEGMASISVDDDVLAAKISSILRRLMAIEVDAANGGSYCTSSTGEMIECGDEEEDDNALRICVPYFGTIKIERSGLSRSILPVTVTPDNDSAPSVLETPSDSAVTMSPALLPSRETDTPLTTNAKPTVVPYSVGVSNDWQAGPAHIGPLVPTPSMTQDRNAFKFPAVNQDMALLVPGLAAGADDWALQGVDMAFFDSLIRGWAAPDGNLNNAVDSSSRGWNTGV